MRWQKNENTGLVSQEQEAKQETKGKNTGIAVADNSKKIPLLL